MRCMSLLTPKEKNTAACCARNASAFAKLKILPAATLQCKISYFSILQSDLHLATKSGADCDAAYGPEKQSAHVRRLGAPPCLLVVFPSSASLYLPLAALRLRHPTRNMYRKVLIVWRFCVQIRTHRAARFVQTGRQYIFYIRRGLRLPPLHHPTSILKRKQFVQLFR